MRGSQNNLLITIKNQWDLSHFMTTYLLDPTSKLYNLLSQLCFWEHSALEMVWSTCSDLSLSTVLSHEVYREFQWTLTCCTRCFVLQSILGRLYCTRTAFKNILSRWLEEQSTNHHLSWIPNPVGQIMKTCFPLINPFGLFFALLLKKIYSWVVK